MNFFSLALCLPDKDTCEKWSKIKTKTRSNNIKYQCVETNHYSTVVVYTQQRWKRAWMTCGRAVPSTCTTAGHFSFITWPILRSEKNPQLNASMNTSKTEILVRKFLAEKFNYTEALTSQRNSWKCDENAQLRHLLQCWKMLAKVCPRKTGIWPVSGCCGTDFVRTKWIFVLRHFPRSTIL